MPVRKTLKLSNIELSYLEWNEGKQPLMLLHGLADHALVWSSLGDYLAANYHIVAPDLRGHGESSKPEQGYTFADYIADLEALREHLGWDHVHVLAHSWSAKFAPIWVTKYPQSVRSLILVDPFFIQEMPRWLEFSFPILYKVLPFLQGMGPFSNYEQAENIAKNLKQYQGWTNLQQQVFRESLVQNSDGTWVSKFTVNARNQIFDEVLRVSGLTQSLDIPTLFIKPKQGLNRLELQLKPYKTYLKNLQITEVPGNHWCFLVEPDAFNATIAEFLKNKGQGNE